MQFNGLLLTRQMFLIEQLSDVPGGATFSRFWQSVGHFIAILGIYENSIVDPTQHFFIPGKTQPPTTFFVWLKDPPPTPTSILSGVVPTPTLIFFWRPGGG